MKRMCLHEMRIGYAYQRKRKRNCFAQYLPESRHRSQQMPVDELRGYTRLDQTFWGQYWRPLLVWDAHRCHIMASVLILINCHLWWPDFTYTTC